MSLASWMKGNKVFCLRPGTTLICECRELTKFILSYMLKPGVGSFLRTGIELKFHVLANKNLFWMDCLNTRFSFMDFSVKFRLNVLETEF